MIYALLVVLVLAAHAAVGQRGIDNARRLYKAVCKRAGIVPRAVPASPWRHLASFFLALIGAPWVGVFLVWQPKRRRPYLALVACGMANAAGNRGALCEHDLVLFDTVITSWTFRFGEEIPGAGREPPDIDEGL